MPAIQLRTHRREEFVNITDEVGGAVRESGVQHGLVTVFVPHTTAGVTINENADPDVVADMLAGLKRLVPQHASYRHVEGNSDAHIKASLMGAAATVIVRDGQLVLGTWQGIYFCEFDGPRIRSVVIEVR